MGLLRIRQRRSLFTLLLILVLLVTMAGCARDKNTEEEMRLQLQRTAVAADFAPYPDYAVEVQPTLSPYTVAPDLRNVDNGSRFEFTESAKNMLVENSFVVLPNMFEEFYSLYEINRYELVPSLITCDAMLHNYHLYYNNLLERIEVNQLIPELQAMNKAMLQESSRQYEALKGTAWENAARRNLAFITVGTYLLDSHTALPAPVKAEVQEELTLINDHNKIEISPVMSIGKPRGDILEDLKEDYTQYIPRGHYTKSEPLQNYFRSIMWYGRLTFRQKDQDETRSAVLLTLGLKASGGLDSWQKIYETTGFMVGKSDDPDYYAYNDLLYEVYGSQFSLQQIIEDEAGWQNLNKKISQLQPPAINSIPIFDAELQPDKEREIKGFRFMGQRYTLDADIFQRLVYREVLENPSGERRNLPSGLDIPAAMGSNEALAILDERGHTAYEDYSRNMEKMRSYTKDLPVQQWTQNLYWNWLYTLKPLAEEKPQGYPSFMRSQAWQRKQLNAYLGSWTELKHDTILYAKQVYAEMGGGADESLDDRGFVEPQPELYARLASLTAMTREGLSARQMIDQRDQENLQRLEELALKLRDISIKELSAHPLTDEDYELIRSFGGQLEHFWAEALRYEGAEARAKLWENPAALIADVATSPGDNTVLEEATGYVHEIYAVVPVAGSLRIARGAVYSYYEFAWPANDRLTDQAWRQMLDEKSNPNLPDWTSVYTGQGPCRLLMSWE